MRKKIWTCKIGEARADQLPDQADGPMRSAVARAYLEATGQEPDFCFSGWDGKLDEAHRAVVEDREPVPDGCTLIRLERERQVEVEGFCDMHDADHDRDQLAWAAACYAAPGPVYRHFQKGSATVLKHHYFSDPWPFGDHSDKRSKHDRKRQLVIAGALVAAELDRLIREEQRNG